MSDESPFGHGPDISQGYVRKPCSVCGEGLSYSESDPCERCSDLQNAVIAAAKAWRENEHRLERLVASNCDLEVRVVIRDECDARLVALRAAIDSLLLAEQEADKE